MAYDDLRDWISALDRAGELKRIRTEADPILEITEIADRVSKEPRPHGIRPGRPGAAVRKRQGLSRRQASDQPIRLCSAACAWRSKSNSLDEIADRIRAFMDVKSPQGFLDKVKMLPMLAEMGKFFPKTVPTGPCKEVIQRDNFSLLDFPILQCWPKDGGRFITLPCVITRDPKTGKRNVGMYRMQVYDGATTGMHWQRQKVAAEHYRERMRAAAAAGESESLTRRVDIMARIRRRLASCRGNLPAGRMDVAVAIGTDPALTFSAIVPAPPDVEEYHHRRLPSPEADRTGEVRNRRPRSPGLRRDHSRGLRQPRRTPHRRPLRRSHRFLLPRRSLSRLSRHLHHPSQGPDLRDHDRRQAAHGRRLDGQGRRTHLPSADEAHHPRMSTSTCPSKASSTT